MRRIRRQASRLAGPILTLPDEPRVAAMEFNLAGRAPLEVMTIEKLKKRGLEELFLFKTSSFGKQSAGLAGRCSLDFTSGDRYLYIRNTGRGTGSELRAEPGDLVLTKEGDFVGWSFRSKSSTSAAARRRNVTCFPMRSAGRTHRRSRSANSPAKTVSSVSAARSNTTMT